MKLNVISYVREVFTNSPIIFFNCVTEIAGPASNLNYSQPLCNTENLIRMSFFFFFFFYFKFIGVREQESQEQEHNGEKSVSTNYPEQHD
jgi:hypothetical protein